MSRHCSRLITCRIFSTSPEVTTVIIPIVDTKKLKFREEKLQLPQDHLTNKCGTET